MLKKILYPLSIATVLWLAPSCSKSASQDGLGHNHEHEHAEGHGHDHDHDHEAEEGHVHSDDEHAPETHSAEISLDQHRAEELGVVTTEVTPGDFAEVIKVSGQIVPAITDASVVSATSSGIVNFNRNITEGAKVNSGTVIATISSKGVTGGDSNEQSRVALDAAKRELDRVEPLHADGIISTKDYNAIKQAYEQAKASYSGNASGSAAVSRQNGIISQLLVRQGEYVETGQPIAAISGNTRLTLRADLPEKHHRMLPSISGANFRPSYSDETQRLDQLNGKLISSSNGNVGTQTGYIPVYFSFDNNGSTLPGSFAEVYLIGTKRHDVIAVPVEAISEQQGAHFVYVRLDEDCYEKRPVTLGYTDGENVEIKSGLSTGDNVVTGGMTFVKLAETSGVVPEGHSHSH